MIAHADLPQPVAAYREMISSPAMTTNLPAAGEQAKQQAVEECVRVTRELREWMIANDPHRPIYHFTGAESWINDPNGPIYCKSARRGPKDAAGGQYHLFYQFDPMVPDGRGGWRRSMRTWGHAVSSDCVHWQDWPVAVWPDTKWDREGVYSGNSFVDDAGNLCAIYTGYTGTVAGHREAYGMLVRSRDGGLTFEKRMVMDDSQRPNQYSPVHWDGQAWKDGEVWRQLVGGSTGEPNRQGAAWLWESRDLVKWKLRGNIAPSIRLGQFWELPYLIFVGGKAVLMVGKGNPYWLGSYDRKKMLFTPDDPRPESFDNGTYYSFNPNMADDKGPGGTRRQIVHGWATIPESPTRGVPWWHGAHSLPRVVTIRGDRLGQEPMPEIESLRGRRRQWKDLAIEPGKGGYLEGLSGDAMEIVVTFAGGAAQRFGVKLRADANGVSHMPVTYDRNAGTFHAAGKGGQNARLAQGDDVTLRIFLDRSIVEVYVNGFAVTGSAFPPPGADGIDLFAEGGPVTVRSVEAWEMKSITEVKE